MLIIKDIIIEFVYWLSYIKVITWRPLIPGSPADPGGPGGPGMTFPGGPE